MKIHIPTRMVLAMLPAALATVVLGGCDAPAKKKAMAMTGGDPAEGRRVIREQGCASCHTIPGIRGANALVGPSLKRVASRSYIAGVMENTPENMIRWLQNPRGVDPMTAMPNLHLTEEEARNVASYIYTLR